MGYTGDQKREYQLRWLKHRRDLGIELLGSYCTRCGSSENLEFDHIDPASKHPRLRDNHWSGFWSWKWDRVLEELAKCQLLCHDCHAKKTVAENPKAGRFNPAVKLTEEEIFEIRASSLSYRTLGVQYDVDYSLIYQIKKRKIWTHI